MDMMPKKEPLRPKTEQEWLSRQARVALDALKGSLKQLKPSKVGALGINSITQEHPLSSTGIAFAAGLVMTISWPQNTMPPLRSFKESTDPWSTLLETGSDILKAVLTPYLQQKLMGTPTSQQVPNPAAASPKL